jgi:hypothetical protein
MSRSKEEIENMKKKEEIHKLNDKNMNIFKKIITQKITVESEDEDDEKKEKNNLGKLNQNIIENSKNINNSENIEEKKREKEEEKKDNKKEEKNNLKNEEKKEETKPNLLLFGQSTSTNQSLFGTIGNNNTNNNNSTSLFGNKDNNNSTSIFSNTNNNNSTSLFGNSNNNNSTSIFSNTNNNNSTSLFGNKDNEKKEENNSNSFSHIFKQGNLFKSTLFSNLEKPELTFSGFKNTNSFFTENNDKKEENEEEENELFNEEEENKPKSEKPKPLVSQDFSNYDKKYNNHIDNFYVFSRITKKYVSKGNGFLSVEISKDKNKKSSVIVFRNQGGNKLVEGFIRPNISKIEGEEKNYKNIATIWYIYLNELGNTELGAAKIPFSNSEDFKNFKTAFEESIKYIEGK